MSVLEVLGATLTSWRGWLFILIAIGYVWAANRLLVAALAAASTAASTVLMALVALVYLATVSLQYWVLTGRLLYEFIELQIGVYIFSAVVAFVLQVVSQISTPDKRNKIRYLLPFINESPAVGLAVVGSMIIALVVQVYAAYGALHGTFAFNDPATRQAEVSFYIFTLPSFVSLIAIALPQIASLMSPYFDNDMRNGAVTLVVSYIIQMTFVAALPFVLFPEYFGAKFGFLPSKLQLLVGPLAVAIALIVPLYLIGSSRFKAESEELLLRRRRLVAKADAAASLPPGTYATGEKQGCVQSISYEVEQTRGQSTFYTTYVLFLVLTRLKSVDMLRGRKALSELQEAALLHLAGGTDGQLGSLLDQDNPFQAFLMPAFRTIAEHGNRLAEWDIRAAHIEDLFNLYVALQDASVPTSNIIRQLAKSVNEEKARPAGSTGALAGGVALTIVIGLFTNAVYEALASVVKGGG